MDARKPGRVSLEDPILQAVLDLWSRGGREHWLPITGGSMWPLIREGDEVMVVHGDTRVRRGDVVVCQRGGRLVAHRVLRIDRGEVGPVVITKGDNAGHCDAPWDADEMVGRVRALKRDGRLLSLETTGWRTIAGLIARLTLAWISLDRSSRDLKRRLWGPQPNRLTAVLRRRAMIVSTLALHGVQVVVCRWKP